MARYTKQDRDGRYYIESANGRLEGDKFGHTYGEAIDRFAELENADVVEVVRCRDCSHRNPCCHKCLRDNLWHDDEDFCSYGERKEEK